MPCNRASKKDSTGVWTLCNGTKLAVIPPKKRIVLTPITSDAKKRVEPTPAPNKVTEKDRKDAEARAKSAQQRSQEMINLADNIERRSRARAQRLATSQRIKNLR